MPTTTNATPTTTRRPAARPWACPCGKSWRTERELHRHQHAGVCAPCWSRIERPTTSAIPWQVGEIIPTDDGSAGIAQTFGNVALFLRRIDGQADHAFGVVMPDQTTDDELRAAARDIHATYGWSTSAEPASATDCWTFGLPPVAGTRQHFVFTSLPDPIDDVPLVPVR